MAFKIKTLENLGYFSNLNTLRLARNVLTNVDVSNNLLLNLFNLGSNNLTTLDVTQNLDLTELYIDNNNFNTIDISNNLLLVQLYFGENNFSTINIDNNSLLYYLDAINNNLTQNSVDYILNKLDQFGLNGLSGTPELNVQLFGNSPPSAAGLISASNLIAKGWYVLLQA